MRSRRDDKARRPGNRPYRFAVIAGVMTRLLAVVWIVADAPDGFGWISGDARRAELSSAAIQAADISGTSRADGLLARHIADTGISARRADSFVVYDFGETTLAVDAATRFRVMSRRSARGQLVQDVVLSTGGR